MYEFLLLSCSDLTCDVLVNFLEHLDLVVNAVVVIVVFDAVVLLL